jgi:hypothetical protein
MTSDVVDIAIRKSIRTPYHNSPQLKVYFPPEVSAIRSFVNSYCNDNMTIKLRVSSDDNVFQISIPDNITVNGVLDDDGRIHGDYTIVDHNVNKSGVKLTAKFAHGKIQGVLIYISSIHVCIYNYDDGGVLDGYQYTYYFKDDIPPLDLITEINYKSYLDKMELLMIESCKTM